MYGAFCTNRLPVYALQIVTEMVIYFSSTAVLPTVPSSFAPTSSSDPGFTNDVAVVIKTCLFLPSYSDHLLRSWGRSSEAEPSLYERPTELVKPAARIRSVAWCPWRGAGCAAWCPRELQPWPCPVPVCPGWVW